MLTTDLSFPPRSDLEKISRRFYKKPDQFADASRGVIELTRRDIGPRIHYLGPLVPKETLVSQDPFPTSIIR